MNPRSVYRWSRGWVFVLSVLLCGCVRWVREDDSGAPLTKAVKAAEKSAEPVKAAKPVEPAKPADPAKPSKPAETAKPAEDETKGGSDGTLRIIAFGAHPDDCEIKVGGMGVRWAKQGHHVKFVSVTNGDIGHWKMARGPLAQRRKVEVEKAAEILGVTTEVLDIHDGELLPTLEHRRTIVRLIREWKADIVLAPRPNDYHPDHRYTGVLVQDAAYMVTVPFFCPDTPHLQHNPIFCYYSDRFKRPNPFRADAIVSIDDVVSKKLDALGIMVSQFFEGGANGHAGLIPADAAGREKRHAEVRRRFAARFRAVANNFRDRLKALYGNKPGSKVEHAEAFEVCEYGRQPSAEELREIFLLPEAVPGK